MGTIDLKSNIHKIVDGIQSEQLLQTLYDFLKVRETNKPGRLWDTLTEEQKQEVLLAYENGVLQETLIFEESIIEHIIEDDEDPQ